MLEELFSSKARVNVLALLLLNPTERFYQRQIAELTGLPIRAVQREMMKLSSLGLLSSTKSGNRVYYQVNERALVFPELKQLILKTQGPAYTDCDQERLAMARLDKIPCLTNMERAALAEYLARLREACGNRLLRVVLFGSKARGDSEPESDIDLFVVLQGEPNGLKDLLDELSYDVSLNCGVVLADFVVGEQRYRWMSQHREPLLLEVEREGVELWRSPNAMLSSLAES